jgi:hypothetical protein
MAEDKLINLTGWDGRQMRPYSYWQNADAFVEAGLPDGHFHVDLIPRD